MLKIEDLFENLDAFEHRAIFDGCKDIWEVVSKIKVYLNQFFKGFNKTPIIKGEVGKRVTFVGKEIFIDEGAIVEDGVSIYAPCIIGKETVLRQGAYLRGCVIIGQKCVIGHATEIKNALLMNESKAPHFNYVGDSIIGQRVNLGAGVILANFKSGSNNPEIIINDGREEMRTGLRKLGAILGDDVHIGCNAVLNPGTIVGKGSVIYPLASVKGVINPYTIIKYKPFLKEQPKK